MHPIGSLGHLEYVGHEGAINSVHNNRDAQIGLCDATVLVEATKFFAIADMEALYKLDLRGKTDEDWREYHEFIDV